MRINYISSASLPSRAAHAVNVVKMCNAFASLGHEVALSHRGAEERSHFDAAYGLSADIRCVAVNSPEIPTIGGVLFGIAAVSKLRSTAPADLYYGRHIYGALVAASMGAHFALELHQVPSTRWLRRAVAWLSQRSSCVAIVVISAALKRDLLIAVPGLPASQVIVAHDGADPLPLAAEQGAFPREPNNKLQVGYVGHLYEGKGMEIISRLPAYLPDAEFHIVGGTEADIASWRGRCAISNLYFHGFVPHADLAKVYDGFDVVLAPLQQHIRGERGSDIARWTSPLKVFEYMAAGKAIVASDLPVLREVLVNERNCLLVSPTDVQAWAEAIRKLANDAQLRSKLALQAQDEFNAEYTWKHRAQSVLGICIERMGLAR